MGISSKERDKDVLPTLFGTAGAQVKGSGKKIVEMRCSC